MFRILFACTKKLLIQVVFFFSFFSMNWMAVDVNFFSLWKPPAVYLPNMLFFMFCNILQSVCSFFWTIFCFILALKNVSPFLVILFSFDSSVFVKSNFTASLLLYVIWVSCFIFFMDPHLLIQNFWQFGQSNLARLSAFSRNYDHIWWLYHVEMATDSGMMLKCLCWIEQAMNIYSYLQSECRI